MFDRKFDLHARTRVRVGGRLVTLVVPVAYSIAEARTPHVRMYLHGHYFISRALSRLF